VAVAVSALLTGLMDLMCYLEMSVEVDGWLEIILWNNFLCTSCDITFNCYVCSSWYLQKSSLAFFLSVM